MPPKAGRAKTTKTKARPGKAPDTAQPSSESPPEFDLTSPEFYLNRELTWLAFNKRVLNEAADSRTPLLERVKFLAIVSSNLDEFFMKRIGGLKLQVSVGVQDLTVDGRTPLQQIEECYVTVRELEAESRKLLPQIL
ncbi:MAG: RNA degradosome polyphosphate kinase, partial [Gammaproteobacteria bacterium]|nr:RNA degradosome polyphosphate kinase [Gammaproteobacteria bacterium]